VVPGFGGGEALVHFHVHGGGGVAPPEQGAGALASWPSWGERRPSLRGRRRRRQS